jgi:hypothetical protein
MSQPDAYKRSRHQSQAVQVSSFGKPIETAKSGYGKRLTGSPIYAIPLVIPGDASNFVIGDLTAGLWCYGIVNHQVGVGTLALTVAADAELGLPAIALSTALPLATAAFVSALAAGLPPLAYDRVLTATIAGGTVGALNKLSLLVAPVTPDWA